MSFFKIPFNSKVPTSADRDSIIENHIQKRKEIVYGAKAMNKQMKMWIVGRPTEDYDVFSKKPGESAKVLEKTLDKTTGRDQYYTKQANYKDTKKVMSRGFNLDDPSDDYGVADFTLQKSQVKTKTIKGIMYADISHREETAMMSLKNPEFKFRHQKDIDDLKRIKISRRF